MYQITKTRKAMNSNRDHPKTLTSFMDGPLLNYWVICCRLSSSQDQWDAWVSQVAIFLPKLKMSFQTSFLTRPQTNGSTFTIRPPTKWLLRYVIVMFGSNSICYSKHSISINRYFVSKQFKSATHECTPNIWAKHERHSFENWRVQIERHSFLGVSEVKECTLWKTLRIYKIFWPSP